MLGKHLCHLHPLLSFHVLFFIVLSLLFLPTMQVAFNYNNFSESSVTFVSTLPECTEQLEKICLHGKAYVGDNGELDMDSHEAQILAIYSKTFQLSNKQTNKTANFSTEFSFIFNGDFLDNELEFFISKKSVEGFSPDSQFRVKILQNLNFIELFAGPAFNNAKPIPGVLKANSKLQVLLLYNSLNSNLTVSVDSENSSNATIFSLPINLQNILPEYVSIGFFVYGMLKITSWSFTSNIVTVQEQQRKRPGTELVVNVVSGIVLLISLFGLTMIFWKCKMKKQAEGEIDGNDTEEDWILDAEFEEEQHGPKKLSYHELEKATNHFNPKRKLGEGGFGPVYRGFLKYRNVNVAIKRISGHSKQGKKEYIAEVKIISQMRHKNMVQLIGWCHENGEFLLVYELMENGSLDSYLFDHEKSLSWSLRYTISKGLASALIYLHQEGKQCVVHRDVKAGNVMLDKSFNAKLGDFGLARLSDHGGRAKTTFIGGTIGYMAPEYLMTGKGSKKSDVYAFGIVALEIVCGRKCIDHNTDTSKEKLDEWVWKMYGCGRLLDVVDERILNGDDYIELQVKQLLMVGLCCAHPDFKQRPSMSHVLGILNFESPMPPLPMTKPEIGITTTRQQSNISCTTDATSNSANSFVGAIELSNIR